MDRKPLPRSLRYRRPLVVPPPNPLLLATADDEPAVLSEPVPAEDTKKPGAPME